MDFYKTHVQVADDTASENARLEDSYATLCRASGLPHGAMAALLGRPSLSWRVLPITSSWWSKLLFGKTEEPWTIFESDQQTIKMCNNGNFDLETNHRDKGPIGLKMLHVNR